MEYSKDTNNAEETGTGEVEMVSRRKFFEGLGKWSKIVIGATVLGSTLLKTDQAGAAAAWANRGGGRGAAWGNRGGGRGAAWGNRGGGGGAAWANRAGGTSVWANRGAAWANRGGSWINRY